MSDQEETMIVVPRPSHDVLEDLEHGLDVIESDRCCSPEERASLAPARAWLAELQKVAEGMTMSLAEQLVQEKRRTHRLEAEVAELRRLAGGLTALEIRPDGAIVVGPVGWHQLQAMGHRRPLRLPDIRMVLMAVQAGSISTGRAVELVNSILSDGDYTLPAPTTHELDVMRRAAVGEDDAPLAVVANLRVDLDEANVSVVAFGCLWAQTYAAERGWPKGHMAAGHYDILAKAGARMVDFTRVEQNEKGEPKLPLPA